jgi:hypothetical protein
VDLGAVASGTGGVRAVLSRMGGGFLRSDAAWLAEPVTGDGWPEWRGLSGSWSPVSDGLPGLTAWTSPTAGAKAQWRVALPEGTYQVQWYRVVSPQHAPSAVIQVAHAGGVLGSTRSLTTGSTGWVTLGTVRISSGVGQVTITGQGTGRLRADAVRFQPVGDTTPVTAVPSGAG